MFTPSQLAGAPAVVDVPSTPYSQEKQFAESFAEMTANNSFKMPMSTQTYNSGGKPSDSDND